MDREKRDRDIGRSSSRPKHARGSGSYHGSTSGSQEGGGYSSGRRGGFAGRGGFSGRGGGATGGKRPTPDRNCYICGKTGHFFKQCPDKKT